jgi:general stress protein YciG
LTSETQAATLGGMKMPKNVKDYLREIGAKGGKAKSAAKKEAARVNGKRGGRPKKKAVSPAPARRPARRR